MELRSTLRSIIREKGVPPVYVIREDDDPKFDPNLTWEKSLFEGPEHNIDRKNAHQIILRNFTEDSDAHSCVKLLINKENGRIGIKALNNQHNNLDMQQERINATNKTLDTVVHRNEREMSFELFSVKTKKIVDALEECSRAPNDGEIVDRTWKKI